MASKFKTAYGEHLHPAQEFDHKKISFKRAGKDINIYDLIQASREDTEIYPTLEKYGMTPNVETAAEFFKNRAQGFFAEFDKTMNLRDFHELQQRAENMWKDLPREVREQFHNDREEFMTEGVEWWNKEVERAAQEVEAEQQAQGVTNNEQK